MFNLDLSAKTQISKEFFIEVAVFGSILDLTFYAIKLRKSALPVLKDKKLVYTFISFVLSVEVAHTVISPSLLCDLSIDPKAYRLCDIIVGRIIWTSYQ